LFTRRGFDWTERYPAIRIALRMLRVRSATIDGEAVCCGEDGIPDFDKLHSHAYNDDVFLYAFDLLEIAAPPILDQHLSECAIKQRCTTGKERRITRWEHELLARPEVTVHSDRKMPNGMGHGNCSLTVSGSMRETSRGAADARRESLFR
jgi:bifunctional non-homologous end joining protein LigD